MSCDFCAWGDPIWKYPCKDFQSEEIKVQGPQGHNTFVSLDSYKEWAACDDCSNLIEQEDLTSLAARSFKSAIPDEPTRLSANQKAKLMNWIRDTHLQFMKNRTGPRLPLQTGDLEGE